MYYRPGDAYYAEFVTTKFSTGEAFDATGTPVALATKNGTDDAWALTVTKLATGRYKVTGTGANVVPVTYAVGDLIQVSITATVDSVAGAAVIDSFRVESRRLSDIHNRVG